MCGFLEYGPRETYVNKDCNTIDFIIVGIAGKESTGFTTENV